MAAYRKILVLLDLSTGSEQVAIAARDMAGHSNANVVALHVVEFMPIEAIGESMMPTFEVDDSLLELGRVKLDALLQGLNFSAASARVEIGNTKMEILRVAEEVKADLIVLGSRERHGLAILINLTEDTILHAANCDVLAVRLK